MKRINNLKEILPIHQIFQAIGKINLTFLDGQAVLVQL